MERALAGNPSTVLVAYDGSPPARRALLHAAALVGRGGRLAVVNVIAAQAVGSRLETVSESQRTQQRRLLREAAKTLADHAVEAVLVAAVGDPRTEIAAAAEAEEAGIVVVGRSGARVRRLVHGSLSSKLIRTSKFDVLVVH